MAALSVSAQPAAESPFVNVRDNGAKGDGKADDTAAIQETIDAAGAHGGGTAYVPPGDYAIRPIEQQQCTEGSRR